MDPDYRSEICVLGGKCVMVKGFSVLCYELRPYLAPRHVILLGTSNAHYMAKMKKYLQVRKCDDDFDDVKLHCESNPLLLFTWINYDRGIGT